MTSYRDRISKDSVDYGDLTSSHRYYGLYVGKVTSINQDESQYMVKVSLYGIHTEDEHATFWARVATGMAGPSTGIHLLPEVDEEVVVAFVNGDDRQPIVLGCLWNGKDKCLASASSLAGDAAMPIADQSEENNVRAMVTKNGQQVIFNEKADEAFISVKTGAGHEFVLSDKGGEEQIQLLDMNGDMMIQIDTANSIINIDCMAGGGVMNINVDDELNIETGGNLNITVGGDMTIGVTGNYENGVDGDITEDAGGKIDRTAGGEITDSGSKINLN